MAALDMLLRSLVKNRMAALRLEPGRLPRLERDGAEHEVTQTVLDAARIAQLVTEVAPAGWSQPVGATPRAFDYPCDGGVFQFLVTAGAAGWSVRATPRPAAEPAASGTSELGAPAAGTPVTPAGAGG